MENNKSKLEANLKKVMFAVIDSTRLRVLEGCSIDHRYDLDRLKNDIQEAAQLLSPVTVVGPYDDETFLIVNGARRYYNLCDMGINRIPCYIVGDSATSVDEATMLALNANRSQRPSTPQDIACYAKMIAQEAQNGKINPDARELILSNGYGISGRMARRYITLVDKAPEKLLNSVINGGLKMHYAEAIMKGYEAQVRKPDGEKTLDMLIDLFYSPEFKSRNKANIIDIVAAGKVKFKNGKAAIDEVRVSSYANIKRARKYIKSVTTSDKVQKSDLKLIMKDFRALLNSHGISVDEFKKMTDSAD